jgi:hypothetical protein
MSSTMQSRAANPAYDPLKVRLSGVTIAYAEQVTKPKAFQAGQEPKYSASFIAWGPRALDMNAQVDAAITAAATAKWGEDRKRWPRLRGLHKEPLVKAVSDFPAMMSDPPAGAVFVRAGSTEAPGVVDAQGHPLTKQEVEGMLFSGWVVNVTMRCFAYEQATGAGVSLGLGNLQLVRPGKRLGGRASAQSEFGPVSDEDLAEDGEDNPYA